MSGELGREQGVDDTRARGSDVVVTLDDDGLTTVSGASTTTSIGTSRT